MFVLVAIVAWPGRAQDTPASGGPVDPAKPDAATSPDLKRLSLQDLMQLKVATESTASKTLENATAAPGTVIVIDQDDIRLRGYSNLVDVLRDAPGMDLVPFSFSEVGTSVGVRGITGNNNLVVLVNGMRVNPPGGEYFPFRNDFSVRGAEQVEIVYGSGSTLYGQDALNGVINVKTLAPPPDGRLALDAALDGGLHSSRDAYLRFAKVLSTADDISIAGYIQYHDSDLSRLDKEYPAWWAAFYKIAKPKGSGTVPDRQDFGLNAFVQFKWGDFTLQSWYRESRRSSAEGYGTPNGVPALGFVPQAIWQDASWVTEAKYVWKITDDVVLDSVATYNWYQVDPSSRYVEALDARHWFYNDNKYAQEASWSIEETARVKFSHSLSGLFGAVFTRYDIVPKSTVPGGATPGSDASIVEQGGNFVYYTQQGNSATKHEVPRVVVSDFDRYGAYGELTWKITPSLKAILGARLDKDTRISDPSVTPRAALIYDLSNDFTMKYTYSWAYVSPAPYFNATYDRGDILAQSNPNLKPETARTHEVNFAYHKEDFNLGLSLYYGEQDNLILVSDTAAPQNVVSKVVYVPGGGASSSTTRELVQTVNAGTSHNAGLDLYGKLRLGHDLSSWFSYSFTNYQQSTDGVVSGLDGISRNNFRLGLTWAVTDKLFITPSLVARSTPQNVEGGKLASDLHNPWEIDLNVLYKVSKHFEVYATVSNLTNNHYALTGFVGSAIPQETISGVVGLRFSH